MPESDNFIHPVDALKSLDQILVADPRNKHIELADWHAEIEEITLVEDTPKEVKQLFENAKNVALYTYFAYRLHQPTQIIGYSALERALKMKFEMEKERNKVQGNPSRLIDYMNIALEQKWITSQGYTSSRHIAEARVEHKKISQLIEAGALNAEGVISFPEAEEHEIQAEMGNMNIAESRLHAERQIRNYLAHGKAALSPSSLGTLRNIAEGINQLFKS